MIRFLLMLLATLPLVGNASQSASPQLFDPAEAKLDHSLALLGQGKLDDALSEIDALLAQQPTFQLGHAIRADIMSQLAGQQSVLAHNADLSSLRHEASQRFASQRNTARHLDLLPANLLEPHPSVDTIVLVDLTANRLYQYEKRSGAWQQVGDHYVTIGKSGAGKLREGDNRTPIGIYRVQPFMPDEALPELYGYGALPLDYPNPWDKHQRRTGSGIWIHGQPRTSYARPPQDSEGCVVISNRAMPGLHNDTTAGATPVIMVRAIDWVDRNTLTSMRDDLSRTLETWRRSWASGDIDQFMALHAANFRNDHGSRARFEKQKRNLAVYQGQKRIRITDREMLLFEDIDGTILAEVRFTQEYASPRYRETSHKRQYWSLSGGTWQLALETEHSPAPTRNTVPVLAAARTAEDDPVDFGERHYPAGR
ncbi:MAG: L,D-transpeptidase family protein [Pseudomonadota bacterium]